MSEVIRLSLSLEPSLYEELEALVARAGYANRSEFFRDLIRARLVEDEWAGDGAAIGTITLLYDHSQRGLGEALTSVQREHHDVILTSTRVQLSPERTAEMVLGRGRASTLRALADALGRLKGVLHSSLASSSLGDHLK